MTWKEYKEWILEEVVDETPSGGFNYYTVLDPIKQKFPSLDNREFIEVIKKLLLSIDDYTSNNIINNGNSNRVECYDLPQFTDNNDNFNTWSKMFPDPNQTYFGKKNSIHEVMNKDTFDILTGIHHLYLKELSLKEELERKASEYSSNNDENNSFTYQDWLNKYQTLSQSNQDALESEKEKVEELLRDLTNDNRQQQNNNDNGNNPSPSGGSNLVIYGVIVVAVLFIIYLLKRWLS